MKRRSFLRGLSLAPFAAVVSAPALSEVARSPGAEDLEHHARQMLEGLRRWTTEETRSQISRSQVAMSVHSVSPLQSRGVMFIGSESDAVRIEAGRKFILVD